MEALSILERVERLEKLAGVAGPAICPDPTGEGSAWQGSPTTTEPAPGSDAKHPPLGYRLAKVGEKRAKGYIYCFDGKWRRDYPVDSRVGGAYRATDLPVANPIPPAEIDRDTRDAEIAELRATVERLTEERDELRGKIESLESLFVEAGTLSIGKGGISVSLGDHALLSHKATHTLYIRKVEG